MNSIDNELSQEEQDKNMIFDYLIKLIQTKNIEIGNWEKHKIPKIYYIGMPKSGSTCIKYGFPDHSVAHWHSRDFFERKYGTKLMTKMDIELYDLILYIGKKYNFKPLIIECIREPISMSISRCFEHLKSEFPGCKCDLCKWKKGERNLDESFLKIIKSRVNSDNWFKSIHSVKRWKKYFDIDITSEFDSKRKLIYHELNNVKLLFIRFNEIDLRPKLFKQLGYKYVNTYLNKTSDNPDLAEIYEYTKSNIGFYKRELDQIYDNPCVRFFFTNGEISIWKKKYKKAFEKPNDETVIKNILSNIVDLVELSFVKGELNTEIINVKQKIDIDIKTKNNFEDNENFDKDLFLDKFYNTCIELDNIVKKIELFSEKYLI